MVLTPWLHQIPQLGEPRVSYGFPSPKVFKISGSFATPLALTPGSVGSAGVWGALKAPQAHENGSEPWCRWWLGWLRGALVARAWS